MTYMKSYVWWHLTTIVVNFLDLAVVTHQLTTVCIYVAGARPLRWRTDEDSEVATYVRCT